jgi:hypothetical protein
MSCSHDDKVDLRLGGTAPESGQADNAKWAYSRPGAEARPELQIRNYHWSSSLSFTFPPLSIMLELVHLSLSISDSAVR